jgi:hypothetical protein
LSNKTSCSFALKVLLEIHVAKCIHISNKRCGAKPQSSQRGYDAKKEEPWPAIY